MIDRQKIFSGTETPPTHLRLDEAKLSAFLREHFSWPSGSVRVEKFRGGQSNPTYRVTADGKSLVLRRRPPGQLVKGAHAIDREFKVMSALHARGLKTPRPYLYVDDERVIGSSFYLVEHVPGRVYWEADMPGASPAERSTSYAEMNHFLADLHRIDPTEAGLDGLSRPKSYIARNLERWTDIYDQSRLIDIPEMEVAAAALRAGIPADGPAVVLHGDYGLYNIIIEPDSPGIAAVIDWEMATLGDALVDLAHHLRAWWDIPDLQGGSTSSLAGLDLQALGIPTMDAYVDAYCERREMPRPARFGYYLAFAQYRYAAMIQGILKRGEMGTASSRVTLHRQERVIEIARLALKTLETA